MAKKKLKGLIGIRTAASLLHVHPETLRRWDKESILKSVRIGIRRGVGDRRYRVDDIERMMRKQNKQFS